MRSGSRAWLTYLRRRARQHGRGVIELHEPGHDVDEVHAPVGDATTAVRVPASPSATCSEERPSRCRSLKEFPVEPGRNRFGGHLRGGQLWRGRRSPATTASGRAHHDVTDGGADVVVVEEPGGLHEVRPAALLRANLDDPVRAPCRVSHANGSLYGVRHGLLAIDVLACGNCFDRHRAVPVVRRRDEKHINVFAFENAAVVLVPVGLVARLRKLGHGGVGPGVVDVARRDERGVGVFDPFACHRTASVAASDDRGPDPIVRASGSRLLLREQRSGPRGSGRGNGQVQEITPFHDESFPLCTAASAPRAAAESLRATPESAAACGRCPTRPFGIRRRKPTVSAGPGSRGPRTCPPFARPPGCYSG